jgi:hypothetical protein
MLAAVGDFAWWVIFLRRAIYGRDAPPSSRSGLLEEEKQGKVISTNILTCVMRELRFFC